MLEVRELGNGFLVSGYGTETLQCDGVRFSSPSMYQVYCSDVLSDGKPTGKALEFMAHLLNAKLAMRVQYPAYTVGADYVTHNDVLIHANELDYLSDSQPIGQPETLRNYAHAAGLYAIDNDGEWQQVNPVHAFYEQVNRNAIKAVASFITECRDTAPAPVVPRSSVKRTSLPNSVNMDSLTELLAERVLTCRAAMETDSSVQTRKAYKSAMALYRDASDKRDSIGIAIAALDTRIAELLTDKREWLRLLSGDRHDDSLRTVLYSHEYAALRHDGGIERINDRVACIDGEVKRLRGERKIHTQTLDNFRRRCATIIRRNARNNDPAVIAARIEASAQRKLSRNHLSREDKLARQREYTRQSRERAKLAKLAEAQATIQTPANRDTAIAASVRLYGSFE